MTGFAQSAVAVLTTGDEPVHVRPMPLPHKVDLFSDGPVLARWSISMQAEGASPATIDLRVGTARLLSRSAGCSILDLGTDDLRAWLATHTNPNTRSTYYGSARALFRWLLAEGLRGDNPIDAMKAPKVPRGAPRPCSTIALHAILGAASPQVRAMVLLAAFQGLRAGEVAAVAGEDIDTGGGTMRVVGKGGVEAVLPLHPEVAALAARMPDRGHWFPSPIPGRHIRSETVSVNVRAACADAGVPLHGAHPLRHWYATWLVRSGADLRTTQTLMRHSSLATTARYVEVSEDSRRAAVLRLPTIVQPKSIIERQSGTIEGES